MDKLVETHSSAAILVLISVYAGDPRRWCLLALAMAPRAPEGETTYAKACIILVFIYNIASLLGSDIISA